MTSATSKRCTSDADFRVTSSRFYSVVVLFLRHLQWFLGILFFGPVQRLWRPSHFSLPSGNVPDKKPKMSRIFVLDSVSSCDDLLQSYRSQYPFKMNFLGLDCEWVNKKGQANAPVALLQIATPLCDCFLIRLCKMGSHLPQTVREILEDKNILKFGVGIQDDVKKLSGMFGIAVLGCVDLRHVVQRCRLDQSSEKRSHKMSLDALAKRILGVTMDKSWRIRCSNWEAEQLNARQIEYAMNDALVASHIFLKLVKLKEEERKVARTAENVVDCSEKKCAVIQNGDLTYADYFDHKFSESESHSQLSELDNKTSMVNFVDKDFTRSNQSSECLVIGRETNIALANNTINNPESQVTEDTEGHSMESINHENSTEINVVSGLESHLREDNVTFCSDVPDCVDCSNVVTFDQQNIYFDSCEVTADLNKMVLEGEEGYFSKEEVIKLLQDMFFCKRASSLCQGVTELAFKHKNGKVKAKKNDKTAKENNKTNGWPSVATERKAYKRGLVRKSPLYMNCMLAAPDGSRLCTLDRKKADWYIEKELGELTSHDPYTVQLKFEPSGRPGSEDSYYLYFKDNICVVCGSDDSYLRKNVVPHDYRRYFPSVMKDHHSHDILLLCAQCHCLSNCYDAKLRKELADKYNAPMGNATVARLINDKELRKVKSAAKALKYAYDRLPEERRQTLLNIVKNYFEVEVVTPEMIDQAVTMETEKENPNYVSHGHEVVRRIREEGKLLEFEKMWRQNFLDTMRPQYLPPLWSVDHRHETLKEKLENSVDT